MTARSFLRGAGLALGLLLATLASFAADFPAPKQGTYTIKDFRFANGQVLPELKLFYQTVGEPTGEPVLVLHGTTGSSNSMLGANFGGELFGAGQPLDATKYFVILPDAIGTGRSSKPSDGMRMNFPKYNYDDMVEAQYRLVREHLGVKHLRLVIGNSMGGMQTWMWAQKYPGYMDIAVPMASLPTEMSGRNWMLRRLLVETIKLDPAWNNGNYTAQPRSLQLASVFFATATNGGNHSYMKAGPNRARADAALDARLKGAFAGDANDHIYQWESSADYNPSTGLEKVTATLLAINSADDERNPVELGILDREIKRVKNGRAYIVPGSDQTLGHGTTGNAKFWKQELDAVLKSAPRIGM
jgi:homoserine O-acetyltransferase/O-succinyltransferase